MTSWRQVFIHLPTNQIERDLVTSDIHRLITNKIERASWPQILSINKLNETWPQIFIHLSTNQIGRDLVTSDIHTLINQSNWTGLRDLRYSYTYQPIKLNKTSWPQMLSTNQIERDLVTSLDVDIRWLRVSVWISYMVLKLNRKSKLKSFFRVYLSPIFQESH
jgi:hypothetical protein